MVNSRTLRPDVTTLRFVVRSVTGYPIGPSGTARYKATLYTVADSLDCYRVLHTFKTPGYSSLTTGQQAERLAARMNADPTLKRYAALRSLGTA